MSKQLAFAIRTHGGSRKNAGRPRVQSNDPVHTTRPRLSSRLPSHVTLRFVEGLPSLRTEKFLLAFAAAIQRTRAKGLQVTNFALESNHIHLIIEVDDNVALTKGMLSLQASLVWCVRHMCGHIGKVFAGRFHLHALRSPTEMKNALAYVLFNHAKHCGMKWFADPFSSACAFKDLRFFLKCKIREPRWSRDVAAALSQPRSWLHNIGWKRA